MLQNRMEIKAKMIILFHRLPTFVKQRALTEFKVSYIVHEADSENGGKTNASPRAAACKPGRG